MTGASRSALREIIETLIVSVLLFFILQSVMQNFQVEGPSMLPTVHSGQLLLVNKAVYMHAPEDSIVAKMPFIGTRDGDEFYLFHPVQRGDIIVFWDEESQQHLIKRVIGLPGENVERRNGRTLIDGQVIDEPYIKERSSDSMRLLTVGLGEYFVMGDNRPQSRDSRSFGPITQDEIVGKAWISFWPLNDFGFLPHYPLFAQPTR